MATAKYSIHPIHGYAVLDEGEHRRTEGEEGGKEFAVHTTGTYLAGYGWGIAISLAGVNDNAPIRFVYDDDIAAGMVRAEGYARRLARDNASLDERD